MKLKSQTSWVLYDFANSAYHLLTITVLFPLCFKQVLYADVTYSDALWSVAVSVPILLSGISAPFVGAYLDTRKRRRCGFVIICLSTVAFAFGLGLVPASRPALAVIVFSASLLLFNLSQFVYNSFLPNQARDGRFAALSGLGWGIGYLGGILCMPLAYLLIRNATLPGDYVDYQKAFCVVAAYFLVFAIPSMLYVKDDDLGGTEAAVTRSPFRQVVGTLRNWRENREILKFLIAFYLINDGLSTLVFFTSIYASTTLDMSTNQIMVAFLIVQAVGIPGTIVLCWLSERWGYKQVLLGCVLFWIGCAVGFLLVQSATHLYILSIAVGLVIGTTPAIARAILAGMVRQDNAAEIYGLHSLSGRASSVLGPLVFGLVSSITGSQALALSSLVVFFAAGFIVLRYVRVDERKLARVADADSARQV